MNFDQVLLFVLGFAVLYRYHRSQLEKAEERYQKCDFERQQLHNFFYGQQGATFTDVSKPEVPQEPAHELTKEERYRERKDYIKNELKRIARTRVSQLGPAIRMIRQREAPSLRKIRPAMDPATAAQVKDKITAEFAEIGQRARVNGGSTNAGS